MVPSVSEAAVKPAVPSFTTSPCALENNTKKEDGGKVEEDRRPSSNQLVPDLAAKLVILHFVTYNNAC